MQHLVAAFVAIVGLIASCLAYLGEVFRWPSYGKFSVATKVPVQIFFVKGPLVMVSAVMYCFLSILLASDRGTGTVFYICSSWSVILLDIGLEFYRTWKEMVSHWIDVVLHLVNFFIIVYSFMELNYIPVSFMLGGSGCWGILVLSRVCTQAKLRQRPYMSQPDYSRSNLLRE